uniref:Uncharacterized protein n=1 Tax=Manihot esculenta TaxID=3983 RepID=A0A2C9VXS2_MANES
MLFFLETSVDSCPSYIWQSILYGREVLTHGLRWQISYGKSVSL